MSAVDLAAVIAGVLSLGAVAVLVVMVVRLQRSLEAVAAALREVQEVAVPAAVELARRAEDIDEGLRRADGLLDRADVVTARAETLSKATYRAVADPVIRTAAAVRGTSQAVRRLRGEGDAPRR